MTKITKLKVLDKYSVCASISKNVRVVTCSQEARDKELPALCWPNNLVTPRMGCRHTIAPLK